jgi:hypothetical protein
MSKMSDERQYAPATLRNRDFILAILRDVLPRTGVILEIASDPGEHIVHFAKNFRLSGGAWAKPYALRPSPR